MIRVFSFFVLFSILFTVLPAYGQTIIDPKIIHWKGDEKKHVFIIFRDKADITAVTHIRGKNNKSAFVYATLLESARVSQQNVQSYLKGQNILFRSFYIVNGISLEADTTLIKTLGTFPEIAVIMEDGVFIKPATEAVKDDGQRTVEWGIDRIKSRQVWAQGFKGQNVVIGGQDTGYKWDHVQLQNKYRGWNGSSANHNYNWHDAIYENHPMNTGNNPCGYNLSVPCDDNNHGTHTMGTMVGNYTTDTIGVAPDAKWIGCRNMERGYGMLSTYVECFEWFLAPYAYGEGPEEGDPLKMPHVINNSWGCPDVEGCNPLNFPVMEEALLNLRSAGCFIVVSNGNSGSNCSTTFDPPAFFEGSFSVGATNSANSIANFSSRGPVTWDGSNRLKPNVSAPGVGVRSSIRNGGYASFNGTSMAGPHVAGAVALIISANPNLAGEVDQIEDILEQTALPLFGGSTCGGITPTSTPNNTFGYGLIDVQKAVARARDSLFTPIIKTDQFGYKASGKKIAVLSNPVNGYNQNDNYSPGTTIQLKNATTHQVVFSAGPVSWNNNNTHGQSGDKVYWFDFSSFSTPGKYYVADGSLRSEDFIIHDTVYHEVFKNAFKTFYYQRCGSAKVSGHVLPGYEDAPCHLQDTVCKFYATPSMQSRWRNLSGGWHDAGDYNKYVNFAYAAVLDLLFSFHFHPEAWLSDQFNIPESGNSIPDVLDEIKIETDWLLRMQESDGGILSMVGVANHATASPPSADNAERLYGPKTTSASYSAASMLAFAAIQFKKINNVQAQTYGNTLQNAAVQAYNWAVANPGATFYNTNVIGAGEQELDSYETDMRKLCAAIFLYKLTGSVSYKNHVETNYNLSHLLQWDFVYPFENPTQLSLLYYAKLPGVLPSVSNNIINAYKNSVENAQDNLPAHVNDTDAYRAHLHSDNYTWGSNRTKCNMANLFSAYKEYELNPGNNNLIEEITTDYVHYIHGRNPVGRCYLSNMRHSGASLSVNSLYHNWFTDGHPEWDDVRTSIYGPAPGFLAGGANPNFSLDNCCVSNTCGSLNSLCINLQPPLLQPTQKAFLDWNTGWPQNSWQITEPAIYYQSAYLFMMAGKVNFTHEETNPDSVFVSQETGEMYVTSAANSLLMKSLSGNVFKLSVANTGLISATPYNNPVVNKAEITTGNLFMVENKKGLLIKSPDQSVWRLNIDNQGAIATQAVQVVPTDITQVTAGDVFIAQPGQGIIFKDNDGLCIKLFVEDSGQLFTRVIPCPMY